MPLDLSGLTPLDTTGLKPAGLDLSGLKPLDVGGLTRVEAEPVAEVSPDDMMTRGGEGLRPEGDGPSEVAKGFTAGVEGMKATGSAFRAMVQSGPVSTGVKTLEIFDSLDRGETPANLGGQMDLRSQQAAYMQATPEQRKEMRAEAEQALAGSQEFRASLIEDWRRYSAEAAKSQGRTPNASDIKDVRGFMDWLGFSAGQVAPSIATMMATTLAGGVLGGPAGAVAGAVGPGYALGAGEVMGGLLEKGFDRPEVAALAGIPMAALEVAGGAPGRLARRFIVPRVADEIAKGYVRRLAGEVPKGAAEESMVEGLQQAWSIAAQNGVTGEAFWTDDNIKSILNSMAVGAVGGGIAAPVTAAGPRQPTAKIPAVAAPAAPRMAPLTPDDRAAPSVLHPAISRGKAIIDDAVAGRPLDIPSPAAEGAPVETPAPIERPAAETATAEPPGPEWRPLYSDATRAEQIGWTNPTTGEARMIAPAAEMPQPSARPVAEQAGAAPTVPVSADQASPAAVPARTFAQRAAIDQPGTTAVNYQGAQRGPEFAARPTPALDVSGLRPVPAAATQGRPLIPGDEPRPTASWVIRNKTTGEVVMETYDRRKVDALNTSKYEAVPIQEYLGGLNARPAAQQAGGTLEGVPQTARPRPRRNPVPLIQWIRDQGGIDPDDPNVADIRADLDTAAFRLLGRRATAQTGRGGRGLDYIREAAVENGYLPEGATINDLLDAIRQDAFAQSEGQPRVVSDYDIGQQVEIDQRERERREADRYINRFGNLDLAAEYEGTRAEMLVAIERARDQLAAEDAEVDRLTREGLEFDPSVSKDANDEEDIPFDFGTDGADAAAGASAVEASDGTTPDTQGEDRGSGSTGEVRRGNPASGDGRGRAGPDARGVEPGGVAPRTERTDQGDNFVLGNDIAGKVTDSDRKAAAERQQRADAEKEMAVKARQQKLRRGGQQSVDDLGIFNRQTDLVDMAGKAATDDTQAESSVAPVAKPSRGTDGTPTPTAGQARIEDFGEKLEGARKDYARLIADAAGTDVVSEPLSKSWPEPDYQKLLDGGADPWIVAFVRAGRDEIPPKPRKAWKVKGWAQQVEVLRRFAFNLLNGEIERGDVLERMKPRDGVFADMLTRVELYQEVGHEKSLRGVRVRQNHLSLFNGQKYDPPLVRWTVEREAKATAFGNWPQELAAGSTREEALAAFKRVYGKVDTQPPADKLVTFSIYSYRGKPGVVIGKKIGSNYLDLKQFDSVKEARAFLKDSADELERLLAKHKEIPSERKETNSPRVGADHRSGADVTPEQFGEAFGFRGVQFGNYVEGDRRQQNLNEAYDALMDLAGVLDIPPRALSLNASLGLAFGARGHGGKRAFAAHYEPDKVVINLTKNRGAGSLAHEWWHALDNYFSRARSDAGGYVSEKPYDRGDGVRQEMVQAFAAVDRAIKQSELRVRASRLDRTRTKDYWSTGREMSARSFESYIIEKLRDQGASNDYLANIVSPEYWEAATALGLEQDATYPYLEAAEIPAVREAFDEFFRTVEARDTGDGNVALYDLAERQTETAARADAFTDAVYGPPTVAGEKARAAVEQLLARIAPGAQVRTPDRLLDAETGTDRAFGLYIDGIIHVALAGPSAQRTARHEAIHYLRQAGIISDLDWRALTQAARDGDWIGRHRIRERYARQGLTESQMIEEAIAEGYAEWAAGGRQAQNRLLMAMRALKRFFDQVRAAIRRAVGRNPDFRDLFSDIETGRAGRAEARSTGSPFADMLRGMASRYLPAFHGSPHDFDRFSLDKIGTGEGAQAYGWGLYFASRKEIAEHYRDALAAAKNLGISKTRAIGAAVPKAEASAIKSANDSVASTLKSAGVPDGYGWRPWRTYFDFYNQKNDIGYYDELHMKQRGDEVERKIAEKENLWKTDSAFRANVKEFLGTSTKPDWSWMRAPFAHAYQNAGNIMNAAAGGRLYEVNLTPEPEHLLDWDKPLAEQSEYVRERLDQSGVLSPWKVTETGGMLRRKWRIASDMHPESDRDNGREFDSRAAADERAAYNNTVHQRSKSGQDAYEALSERLGEAPPATSLVARINPDYRIPNDRAASLSLLEAGIPGLRYLDAGSRSKGEGSHNYVVFDENAVQVTAKYDLTPQDRALIEQHLAPAGGGLISRIAKSAFRRDIARNDFADTLVTRIVNELNPIFAYEMRAETAAGRTAAIRDASVSAAKMAEFTMNSSGRTWAMFHVGPLRYNAAEGIVEADGTGKGLFDIFKYLSDPDTYDKFRLYASARRGQRMMTEGRERNLTQAAIDRGLAMADDVGAHKGATRTFREIFDDYQAFNAALLNGMGRDTGLLSQESIDLWLEHADYVPFYREIDEGEVPSAAFLRKNINKPDPGIKTLEGGKQRIADLMDNVARNAEAIVRAGMRNVTMRRIYELAEVMGEGQIVREGSAEDGVLTYRVNGNEVKFTVDDPALVAAVAAMRPDQHSGLYKALTEIASFFRNGIAASPKFMLRNLVRGTMAGFVQTGKNINVNNVATGLVRALRNDRTIQEMKAISGTGAYTFSGAGSDIGALMRRQTGAQRDLMPIAVVRKTWGVLEKFGEATELADREAIYSNLLREGKTKAEAAYQAMNLINYSRRGSSKSLRFLLPLVPFLNARIQGLYRMAETQTTGPERAKKLMGVAARGLVLTAVSAALYAMNGDDERYDDEPMHRKLNYYILYAGDTRILIPKAFEFGAIFSSIPELIMDAVAQKEGKRLAEGLAHILLNTFELNPIPQAALPILENIVNYSFFTGRELENQRLQNLPAAQRYTAATPRVLREIGRMTDLSPVKMENLISGYTGLMGMSMLAGLDSIGRAAGVFPSEPTGAFGNFGMFSDALEDQIGSMVRVGPDRASRWVGDLYEMSRDVNQAYREAKSLAAEGDVEAARRLAIKEGVGARKFLNKQTRALGNLNKLIRQVDDDPTLSGLQKRAQLNRLYERRNTIAETAVKAVKGKVDAFN